MTRTHQLDRIIGKAESLNGHLPNALVHLNQLAYQSADIHAATYDRTPSGTAELTPTEAAANRALRCHDQRDYILGLITAAEKALDQALAECRQTLGIRVESPQLCDGRHLDGWIEWGDVCNRPADKAGLCLKHYMRCYRWRRLHCLVPIGEAG